MLTFTQAQLNTFQASWQVEQLQSQLPPVMARLAQDHPNFYAANENEHHHYRGRQLIEQAVLYGYTQIEHIQQLLDLEYGARKRIYAQSAIQPLFQAKWLAPQDRINAMRFLIIQNDHQYHNRGAIYGPLQDYPRDARCKDIVRQTLLALPDDSVAAPFTPLLRQALYHALLKDKLQTSPGWLTWQSDWQQAHIGIEHTGLLRRIQLQPADRQALQVALDDSTTVALLTLSVPDQLSDAQHARLNAVLHAWALDLLQVEPMRALCAVEEKLINQ